MKYFVLFTVILVGVMFYAGNRVLNSFEQSFAKSQGEDWIRMKSEANKGNIFKQRTNGIDNSRLIKTARNSMLEPKGIIVNGDVGVIPADSKFDPAWFGVHKPRSVEYQEGEYKVSWLFLPGCEERTWDTTSTLNWYDQEGTQCSGGWNVSVNIDSNLEANSLELQQR